MLQASFSASSKVFLYHEFSLVKLLSTAEVLLFWMMTVPSSISRSKSPLNRQELHGKLEQEQAKLSDGKDEARKNWLVVLFFFQMVWEGWLVDSYFS